MEVQPHAIGLGGGSGLLGGGSCMSSPTHLPRRDFPGILASLSLRVEVHIPLKLPPTGLLCEPSSLGQGLPAGSAAAWLYIILRLARQENPTPTPPSPPPPRVSASPDRYQSFLPVTGLGTPGIQLLQPQAQMYGKPDVATCLTRRINGLVVPLDQALRVGEASCSSRYRCRWQERDLSLDVSGLQLTAL